MSTDLSVILQNSPGLIQTGLDEDTLAVAGGSNTGTKRISIRGKAFRKIVGGKEVAVVEDNNMNIIIVKMAHTASRMFYADVYKEGDNKKTPPSCWSSDSRAPDAEVKVPQSKTCDTCQFNAKGSGAGGIGTACKLTWRMAVVLPNDPAGDVMQLVLPATSCFGKEDNGAFPFRPYIQMLANNNISAGRLITKMKFDPKSSTPKVLFSPAAAIPPEDMEAVQRQAKSAIAEQLVKLTVHQATEETETEVQQEFETKPAQATVQATPAQATVAEPTLRGDVATEPKANNVSDIINKWSSKQ